MAKFATLEARHTPATRKPYSLGPDPKVTRTGNGAVGFTGEAHVELFNAAVSGLLTDQFYESSDARIKRLISLVPQCDPVWLANFIPWLRDTANLRSAPIVLAAEYARAGFPNSRKVVASALQRADEPAELLGYWMSKYGRNVPSRIKRGVSDALKRLYNERSLLRYDGQGRPWRFGDVIEFVHPTPGAEWQNSLYKFALDRRRHSDVSIPDNLSKVARTLEFERQPESKRRSLLGQIANGEVEFSWERLAGWLPGGMDAQAWEAVIPHMGYMALIRNLNNFDRAGISREARQSVIERLTNADQIRRSKLLPFRFLSAYKALESDTYRSALADAVEVAVENLPSFEGHTLIMVDCSGSMDDKVGGKNASLSRSDVAGFLAEALARRCVKASIATYGTSVNSIYEPQKHVGVLKGANDKRYKASGGTRTWQCVNEAAAKVGKVDRIVVLTDEQSSDSGFNATVPVITWNLAGYGQHHAQHGAKNLYLVSGFNDTALQTLPDVVAFRSSGKWPWD